MVKFGWLDYSKEDSSIIDSALRELEKRTVEQLGFSSVRNNFRALLFPGAANPMTRLRYNYFVAYIANNLDILGKYFDNKSAVSIQTAAEQKIRDNLVKGSDTFGVFGKFEKNRVPYKTYWGNLYIYGLADRADFPSYGHYFEEVDQKRKNKIYEDKNEGDQVIENSFRFTHEKLTQSMSQVVDRLIKPPRVKERDEILNFKLTHEETEHFKETIRVRFPDSLLKIFINDRKLLLHGKNPAMGNDDPEFMWHAIEERYLLGASYNSLSDTLKKNLTYTFVFLRLMGVAYNYYNAILYRKMDDRKVLSEIDEIKNETIDAIEKYQYAPDEAIVYISTWGSKQGHIFLSEIYKSLIDKKDHQYFQRIVIAREASAKTPMYAKLTQKKYESGNYVKFSFGYDLNIDMVRRYLADMEV